MLAENFLQVFHHNLFFLLTESAGKQMALVQLEQGKVPLSFIWYSFILPEINGIPELPRSSVLELAAPLWDSSLLEAQSGSLKMRLAALI